MFAKEVVGTANGMFATRNILMYCYRSFFLSIRSPFSSKVLLPDGGILERVCEHSKSEKGHIFNPNRILLFDKR